MDETSHDTRCNSPYSLPPPAPHKQRISFRKRHEPFARSSTEQIQPGEVIMDASPFAKLAPELRNHIYELVMSEDVHVCANKRRQRPAGLETSIYHPKSLGLSATCRQIQRESTQLFYARNDFYIWGNVYSLITFVGISASKMPKLYLPSELKNLLFTISSFQT